MEMTSPTWRQELLQRLERDMAREMLQGDLACLVWNDAVETLTVQSPPLLSELRGRNLISNVYRSRSVRRDATPR